MSSLIAFLIVLSINNQNTLSAINMKKPVISLFNLIDNRINHNTFILLTQILITTKRIY